jgi:hypothetical protein
MAQKILRALLGVGLLVFGIAVATAQDRDRDRDDSFYQSRDSFYRGEHWRGRLFQRVREDVDRVQASTFPVSTDEFRLAKTKHELDELQDQLAAGHYDERELDDVISALQRVVTSNKLSGRDRDMLTDDLSHMRVT